MNGIWEPYRDFGSGKPPVYFKRGQNHYCISYHIFLERWVAGNMNNEGLFCARPHGIGYFLTTNRCRIDQYSETVWMFHDGKGALEMQNDVGIIKMHQLELEEDMF